MHSANVKEPAFIGHRSCNERYLAYLMRDNQITSAVIWLRAGPDSDNERS